MDCKIVIFLIVLNIVLIASGPVKQKPEAATCHNCHPTVEGKINVHLIPHSHDDVGWLKTVDQYYFGSGAATTYENAGVQYIISSAIEALRSHPDRRFIQVETAFFWKWWQNQNEQVRQDVADLVNNGQLEIINGAWSMNDEAVAHYHSIIDQFTWGFRFLNDTFGECARPKIGWQIDPFGHSKEHASLMTQMGFQGLFIGRIDYRDKEHRRGFQNLDFIWNTNDNLENSKIFTSMFPDLYSSESGFCFDIVCHDKPIYDDEESPDYNLPDKVAQFARKLDVYKNYYKTSNIPMPMGGDFNYQAAEINFSNLDKLIKGFKVHKTYNLFYSTPSCHIQAVNAELNKNSVKLSEKSDDFFPYASDSHAFWTGFYSSRPTSKRYERLSNNILQSAKQLAAFSKLDGKNIDDSINDLKSAMGIMQHHDAITGTEKQTVANDYARLLTKAVRKAEKAAGIVIGDLLKKNDTNDLDLKLSTCLLANVSICIASRQQKFIVAVQNPLAQYVTHYVRLPVDGNSYIIRGPDGEEVYDVLEKLHSFDYVDEDEGSTSLKELVFAARNLPPLGIKLYYIEQIFLATTEYKPFKKLFSNDNYFGTETNGFSVDVDTGRLVSVTLNSHVLEIAQDFLYYTGSNGNNAGVDNRASGAYIFRPTENQAVPITTTLASFKGTKGNLVDEFKQVFNDEVTQIIRVYKGENDNYIEFDWLVGNLQYVDRKGKEVITRFSVNNFVNDATFYTDSNGRQQIKRQLNKRSDYDYDPSEEPIASNYYPVTSKIAIEDEEKDVRVAILNDRAQGGTSLSEGSIELMIHRRCTSDDGFGVIEILGEKQYGLGLYVRGQHFLTFGSFINGTSTVAFERQLAVKKLLSPWVLVADATSENIDSFAKIDDLVELEFQGLTEELPKNVHLLTFESWIEDTFILRFEHIMEKKEDQFLSEKVTINLDNLFTRFNITEIRETTLGANQFLSDYNNEEKLIWNGITITPLIDLDSVYPLQVELSPMQVRTFVVKVIRK